MVKGKIDEEIEKRVFADKCSESPNEKHKWSGIICQHCKKKIGDVRLQKAIEKSIVMPECYGQYITCYQSCQRCNVASYCIVQKEQTQNFAKMLNVLGGKVIREYSNHGAEDAYSLLCEEIQKIKDDLGVGDG